MKVVCMYTCTLPGWYKHVPNATEETIKRCLDVNIEKKQVKFGVLDLVSFYKTVKIMTSDQGTNPYAPEKLRGIYKEAHEAYTY